MIVRDARWLRIQGFHESMAAAATSDCTVGFWLFRCVRALGTFWALLHLLLRLLLTV